MQPSYAAPAARKALDILELMVKCNTPFTVSELAASLEIPVNSVFRILKELEGKRYVEKNVSDSSYILTSKLYFLGNAVADRISLKATVQKTMQRICRFTKETTLLTAPGTGYSTLVVDQLVSTEPIKFVSTIGLEYDSYPSAMGKAMLAFLPDYELEEYLQTVTLEPVTPYTITSRNELRRQLMEIRKSGIAFDREESVVGLKCTAVPIFSGADKLEGALGISGLAFRLPDDRLQDFGLFIRQQIRDLSETLGHTEN